MTVKQVLSIADKTEVNQILVFPTKMQFGPQVKLGNFISLSWKDPRLDNILDEEVISLSAYNNLLSIRI